MRAAAVEVPLTSSNQKVVPPVFDKYIATFVTQDHLFAGRFRDLLQVAFVSCRTKPLRRKLEQELRSFARDSGVPFQRCIYDIDTNRVLSMSMSQLYSLIPCLHAAYSKALSLQYADPDAILPIMHFSEDCLGFIAEQAALMQRHTLCILKTFADLVRVLWQSRTIGFEMNGDDINKYAYSQRQRCDSVFAFCTPSMETLEDACRSDYDATMQGSSISSGTKRMYTSYVASVSKPDIHRLNELRYQCWFMWPQITWCESYLWIELVACWFTSQSVDGICS